MAEWVFTGAKTVWPASRPAQACRRWTGRGRDDDPPHNDDRPSATGSWQLGRNNGGSGGRPIAGEDSGAARTCSRTPAAKARLRLAGKVGTWHDRGGRNASRTAWSFAGFVVTCVGLRLAPTGSGSVARRVSGCSGRCDGRVRRGRASEAWRLRGTSTCRRC